MSICIKTIHFSTITLVPSLIWRGLENFFNVRGSRMTYFNIKGLYQNKIKILVERMIDKIVSNHLRLSQSSDDGVAASMPLVIMLKVIPEYQI